MLAADKRALEQNLKVNLLKIREKELRFYTDNCVAIGTQASLLSGFAYSGLIQIVIPEGRNNTLITAYLCVTVTAMGLELIAVINAMLCSMLGPGLALRGPDGSMHKAVDEMLEEYRLTFFFFGVGLVAFHFSAILFAWVEFIWSAACRIAKERCCHPLLISHKLHTHRDAAFCAQDRGARHVARARALPVRHVPLLSANLRAF